MLDKIPAFVPPANDFLTNIALMSHSMPLFSTFDKSQSCKRASFSGLDAVFNDKDQSNEIWMHGKKIRNLQIGSYVSPVTCKQMSLLNKCTNQNSEFRIRKDYPQWIQNKATEKSKIAAFQRLPKKENAQKTTDEQVENNHTTVKKVTTNTMDKKVQGKSNPTDAHWCMSLKVESRQKETQSSKQQLHNARFMSDWSMNLNNLCTNEPTQKYSQSYQNKQTNNSDRFQNTSKKNQVDSHKDSANSVNSKALDTLPVKRSIGYKIKDISAGSDDKILTETFDKYCEIMKALPLGSNAHHVHARNYLKKGTAVRSTSIKKRSRQKMITTHNKSTASLSEPTYVLRKTYNAKDYKKSKARHRKEEPSRQASDTSKEQASSSGLSLHLYQAYFPQEDLPSAVLISGAPILNRLKITNYHNPSQEIGVSQNKDVSMPVVSNDNTKKTQNPKKRTISSNVKHRVVHDDKKLPNALKVKTARETKPNNLIGHDAKSNNMIGHDAKQNNINGLGKRPMNGIQQKHNSATIGSSAKGTSTTKILKKFPVAKKCSSPDLKYSLQQKKETLGLKTNRPVPRIAQQTAASEPKPSTKSKQDFPVLDAVTRAVIRRNAAYSVYAKTGERARFPGDAIEVVQYNTQLPIAVESDKEGSQGDVASVSRQHSANSHIPVKTKDHVNSSNLKVNTEYRHPSVLAGNISNVATESHEIIRTIKKTATDNWLAKKKKPSSITDGRNISGVKKRNETNSTNPKTAIKQADKSQDQTGRRLKRRCLPKQAYCDRSISGTGDMEGVVFISYGKKLPKNILYKKKPNRMSSYVNSVTVTRDNSHHTSLTRSKLESRHDHKITRHQKVTGRKFKKQSLGKNIRLRRTKEQSNIKIFIKKGKKVKYVCRSQIRAHGTRTKQNGLMNKTSKRTQLINNRSKRTQLTSKTSNRTSSKQKSQPKEYPGKWPVSDDTKNNLYDTRQSPIMKIGNCSSSHLESSQCSPLSCQNSYPVNLDPRFKLQNYREPRTNLENTKSRKLRRKRKKKSLTIGVEYLKKIQEQHKCLVTKLMQNMLTRDCLKNMVPANTPPFFGTPSPSSVGS